MEIKNKKGIYKLKASYRWPDIFPTRDKIFYKNASGEAGSVNMGEVQDQNVVLQDVIADYSTEDISNINETRCFYQAFQ